CVVRAEDGIRDPLVAGVQTCALPISALARAEQFVRYRKPERLGGYEIDDQIEFGRLLDWKLSGAVSESRGYSITSSARVRNDSEIGRASCRERRRTADGAGSLTRRQG